MVLLRALLGRSDDQPAPEELAASIRRLLPAGRNRFAAASWLAWSIVGMRLFAEGSPTMTEIRVEIRRVALTLVMLQTRGNLSAAAMVLETSRRALRDGLRKLGLYPWRGRIAEEFDIEDDLGQPGDGRP